MNEESDDSYEVCQRCNEVFRSIQDLDHHINYLCYPVLSDNDSGDTDNYPIWHRLVLEKEEPKSLIPHPDGDDIISNNDFSCIVCYKFKPQIMAGCCHLCMCINCSKNVYYSKNPKCPHCRKLWKNLVKVYTL